MGHWTDNYIDGASFRGVPFHVPRYEYEFGRRTILHEFPGQDKPIVEDIGRAPRRFTLDCVVIDASVGGQEPSSTYAYERDRLIAEFEKQGSGELVHPWYGQMVVTIVGNVRLREDSTTAGGAAFFTVPVVVATEELEQKEREDTVARVEEACDEALDAEKVVFETTYVYDEIPGDLQSNLRDQLAAGQSKLRAVLGKIGAVIENVNAVVAEIEKYGDLIAVIASVPASLANTVRGLVSRIMNIPAGVVSTVAAAYGVDEDNTLRDPDTGVALDLSSATQDEIDAAIEARDSAEVGQRTRADLTMEAFREMSVWGDEYVDAPTTTPTREKQLQSQQATQRLHQAAATIETCRAMANLTMPSWGYASSARDELTDAIDDLIEDDLTTDESFESLRNLRAAVVLHFEETAQDLPRIQYYTPPVTMPSALAAQIVYRDATEADDLVDRNNVFHPLFVRGGEDLEVLADE
jgi:prophage DNA circulation protein